MFISFLLILVGLVFLLKNLGLISASAWGITWPCVLIAAGVYLVVRTSCYKKRYHRFWDRMWHWKADPKE